MENSERHPDYAAGSCERSPPSLGSMSPWIRIRGTIEGATGIRITIESEQGVQTYMRGHISPIVETEGVEVNTASRMQTETGLLRTQESCSPEISALYAAGARVSEGWVDAEQRRGAVEESFHCPSGGEHPPGEGGESSVMVPEVSSNHDEAEYPEWVLVMFQNMDCAEHPEQ